MLESQRHPDEEEIEKYCMGNLPDPETSCFEEHLLICETCQKRVASWDTYVSNVQLASRQMRCQGRKIRNRWRVFPRWVPTLGALAAMVVLAVLGFEWAARRNDQFASPVAIALVATRGVPIEAKAPAARPLTLEADLTGLPLESAFQMELVDAQGQPVWHGAATVQNLQAAATVPGLPRGIYFLRAYASSGKLLREYGLEVENR